MCLRFSPLPSVNMNQFACQEHNVCFSQDGEISSAGKDRHFPVSNLAYLRQLWILLYHTVAGSVDISSF